ncbi:MAG: beta-ketoacyl-ACP synthase II [Flavobacteriales bacterium]|nr:beta-ketoacyl-ACP synthase II [Flavobacteriales bacterium]
MKRVVVTGLGALTPIGNTTGEYWQSLVNGVSGANPITRFDCEKFKTKFACEVKNFDVLNFIDRKEARKMDPFTQFAVVAADEAMADSGLEGNFDPDRTGIIWGSGIGGLTTFLKECSDFVKGDGTPRFSPFFIPMMISDIAGGHISIKYGLRGPNFTTVSACASSNNAILDAYTYISQGQSDVIVTGGSEACVNEAAIGGFNSMKALSERNDDPLTASRPFDLDRDGFVLGEGAACIILESLDHALARGAKIYAEVAGGGLSADAYHISAPHPEGVGVINVMRYALQNANLKPEDIDYINVHGTSTPLGDIAEVIAIKEVFGEHAFKLNISSTKSMTGHLLGGAGAVEAVASILSIQNDIVPPTINHFTDDPAFDPNLNFTFNKAQKREVRAALSNTFGFGGHNVSVIFKKYN